MDVATSITGKNPHYFFKKLMGEMSEGGQKIETSSYKINKCWECIVRVVPLLDNVVLYM